MEEHRAKVKARKDAWLERHPDQKAIHEESLKDPEAYKKRVAERRAETKARQKSPFTPEESKRYLALKKERAKKEKAKKKPVKKTVKKKSQESTGSEASTRS